LTPVSLFANLDKPKNNKNRDTILSFQQEMDMRFLSFKEDSLFMPEQLQEDFLYFYKKIMETHPNPYHVINKDSMDKRVEDILKSLNKPMNRREFWLKTAVLNAYFDGHTRIFEIEEISEYNIANSKSILPEKLLMLDTSGNIYFNPKYEDVLLAGKSIKNINDIPSKQIADKVSAYYNKEHKKYSPLNFDHYFHEFYTNLFGSTDSFRFEYISDNEIDIHTFYPLEISTNSEVSHQNQQEKEKKFIRFDIYEEESIAIIKINIFILELLGKHYRKDLETMVATIMKKNIKHLFIDISCNGGGGSNLALEILNFIKTEKKKYYTATAEIRVSPVSCVYKLGNNFSSFVKKHRKQLYETSNGEIMMKSDDYWKKNNSKIQYNQNLYLIQSRRTYSAAVDLSSVVKAYKLATIIGGETGGLTGCYIDSPCFAMPNTSILFSCSVQKSVNVGGAMNGKGVLPDIEYKIENPYKSFTLEQLKEMLQLVEQYKIQTK